MRVLLTGASGFIGRHLIPALVAHRHQVVCASRTACEPMGCDAVVDADFTRDTAPEAWLPKLHGIDVVINAVGILREHGVQTFQALHVTGPCALFDACAIAGVRRVINISALGADEEARSTYHLSKHQADQHLKRLPLDWTIVQPSLVYGPQGESARLFTALAALPLIPLPAGGGQLIQPLHIDDLVTGLAALLTDTATERRVVAFVGPHALTLRAFLAELRESMQMGPARFVAVPEGLVRLSARLGDALPGSLLDSETWGMLKRGSTADAQDLQALMQRKLRSPDRFIGSDQRSDTRVRAQLSWLLPILRLSVAAVWIGTGIVSLGLYPVASSYELLARTGVPSALFPLFLYGAALLDLSLGIASLALPRRRVLWIIQIGLILLYTVIISLRLPEFWLHPYGPLLKNLPMLAALILLHALEKR
jgi:uncharacterized protein YbjT (DUF2867 family)